MQQRAGGHGQGRRHRGPMGGPMGGMPTEKAKDFKGTVRRLIAYMGRYKISVLIVLILAAVGSTLGIIGPKIQGNAVTELFMGLTAKISGTGSIDFAKIGSIMLTLLGLYLASAGISMVSGYIMTGVTQKICFNLRKEMSEKIHRMPMSYFESRTIGEVLSRITNDIDTLSQSLNQSITQLISSITQLIGALIMMLTISRVMTLIPILIIPVSMFLISMVIGRTQKLFQKSQEYMGIINGQVEENYSGHMVVKAFNGEEAAIEEFNNANDVLYQTGWRSQFFSGMMQPIMTFIGNLGYVLVAIVGGLQVINGRIQIGDIQSFIQYVRMFTQPMAQVAQVMNMLQSMAAAAERSFEFLNESEEDQTVENPVDAKDIKGEVRFSNVRFGYKSDQVVIHDFSCDVEPGKMIAIVGPTGAGKTTIVKLLMRFYDVDGGQILLDGHDIRRFARGDLRRQYGMVLQDTWLFKGTIMENIRYGRLEATDEEVIAAAKMAHAHHFIQTLPGAYQMELNEEASNVSQGQKQLLTIARAILANNRLLILDEATSSVDTSTEARIQRAMKNLMRGRTSFVIAHRLSTIREADMILVMRDGDIVEQGKHEDLLAKGGFYAELYNSQFEDAVA